MQFEIISIELRLVFLISPLSTGITGLCHNIKGFFCFVHSMMVKILSLFSTKKLVVGLK